VVSPNGFDPAQFHLRRVDRRAHWRRHLVDAPQGWRPGGAAGSIRYSDAAADAAATGPVLISVGRFTAVKRLPLLIEAWARAVPSLPPTASLVLLGGHPGEWEGEHPLEAIERTGARNVLLAGWHGHDELPAFLAASDALVLASEREQFGAVLVEGMACGVPPIAIDRMGPSEVVEDGRTGWLVAPDAPDALAAAIVDALTDRAERARRAEAAATVARARYAWPAIAGALADVLAAAAGRQLAGTA
jgi:glycosyltransferase involved in cell wall biosynthesis